MARRAHEVRDDLDGLEVDGMASAGRPAKRIFVSHSSKDNDFGVRLVEDPRRALGWLKDYPDPQDWLSLNLACSAPYNAGGACDRQADGLINKTDGNPDSVARAAEYQQAEQLLVTEVAWVPAYQSTTWWETQPYVKGYSVASTGFVTRESWQTIFIASH